MTKLELARLIDLAGKLQTRKRLQKVVYLLQAGGCELNVDYTLHHYGPYSQDVALLTDKMVREGLIVEDVSENAMGREYSYTLSERAKNQLENFLESHARDILFRNINQHETLARQLLEEADLRKLEYAATIAYFRKLHKSWAEARATAAEFKKQRPESHPMEQAEELARNILEPQVS